jgi:triosephosphate isomerase
MLVVNFKTFEQASGKKALSLAKKIFTISKKTKIPIVICPQTSDIFRITSQTKLHVYAQHVDPVDPGKKTGHIILENIKEAGAKGVLINHCEHLMNTNDIEFVVNKCRKLGLKSIVCASDPWISEALVRFKPDFITIQPPELIAENISVSKADPQIITTAIAKVAGKKALNKVLVGAGINNSKDVSRALALGASGVMVSSSVIKSKDPSKVVKDLLSGF